MSTAYLQLELQKKVNQLAADLWSADFSATVERPSAVSHGDFSANVALIASRKLGRKPHDLAKEFIQAVESSDWHGWFKSITVAGPGFINFVLTDEVLNNELELMLSAKHYGSQDIGQNKKVNVEFISANPTGPMTLPNGRGGFMGDTLANVLSLVGYQVWREFYINDYGNQIAVLGESLASSLGLIDRHDDLYRGDYIQTVAQELRKEVEQFAKTEDWLSLGQKAAEYLLHHEIKPSVEDMMKIHFDQWYSEYQELHVSGKVERCFKELIKHDLTYESDGATWLKSSQHGDDEDRVLKKSDGSFSYYLVDITYHADKIERGFDLLIDYWGADHYGHIKRMQAAMTAIGYANRLKVVNMQLVTLVQGGKEVRMSKRAGNFVLINDLIQEVGLDVTRYFFLMHAANSHMEFDLDLAKEKSEQNPVYYVQYAHARINSLLEKIKQDQAKIEDKSVEWSPSARQLILTLSELPTIIAEIAQNYELQRLPSLAQEIAREFHQLYNQVRIIDRGIVAQNNYQLIQATRKVLAEILSLMGISSPEKM